ncbi:hypothetical protein GCM10007874_48520 [Labrys miyagiensis]|uniref:Uncharacterized protein n=1 Tax=Labrys miyagiensis TaxID=346912 RepID=A0ABQ6CS94_9HYPH|nr:hypothetical protein GCM10007874_48520 [Labrys miyagiensis]
MGNDMGAIARADLGLIGIDIDIKGGGIDIALFHQHGFELLHPLGHRGGRRAMMVVVIMVMVVIMRAHGGCVAEIEASGNARAALLSCRRCIVRS